MHYCIYETLFEIIHKRCIQNLSNTKKLNILITLVQKYHFQQYITRMPVTMVPTEKGNLKYACRQLWCWQKLLLAISQTKVVNCNNAYKSCHLQLLHTKVVICYCCIQKLLPLWHHFAIFGMASKYAQSITKYTKYSVYYKMYTNETRI